MPLELRDYQEGAVERCREELAGSTRVVLVSPTASGKTVMASVLSTRYRRVLWVAHRVELIEQARSHLQALGVRAGILSGRHTEDASAPVLVASVQMFQHRMVPESDLLVVDEAHRVEAGDRSDLLETRKASTLVKTQPRLATHRRGETVSPARAVRGSRPSPRTGP